MPIVNEKKFYSFGDVLVGLGKCDFNPTEVDTSSRLTEDITLKIPIIGAAMDTTTETKMGIELSTLGCLGVIHRNMDIKLQAQKVKTVKRWTQYLIPDPMTISPDMFVCNLQRFAKDNNYSTYPVVDEKNKLLGIVTKKDFTYNEDPKARVFDIMTKENLITASKNVEKEEAKKLLVENKKGKLLIVGGNGHLEGLITMRDLRLNKTYPNATIDSDGKLIAAAAVGVDNTTKERVDALMQSGVDVIFLDVAHCWSSYAVGVIEKLFVDFPDIKLVVGNIATKEAAEEFAKFPIAGLKIGVGPGSICTTRIISGVGAPQITAIDDCREITDKKGISLIGDGGIQFSGDITKAIAAGATHVMVGGLIAGADESPGEVETDTVGNRYKVYRGMGSSEAMKAGGKNRYYQDGKVEDKDIISQGVMKKIPYTGPVKDTITQLVGGLGQGLILSGNKTIPSLRKNGQLIPISVAGQNESHVHGVGAIKGESNYPIGGKK